MSDHRRLWRAALVPAVVAVAAVAAFVLALDSASAAGLIGARAAHQADRLLPASQVNATRAIVTAVRVENTADAAQLVFAVSRRFDAKSFVLADPNRAIIDLPEVDFALDPQVGVLGTGRHRHAKRGLIESFRFGLLTPGRSRIVIDLAQPARVINASTRLVNGQTQLVVHLARTDRASFVALASARNSSDLVAMSSKVPAPSATPIAEKATNDKPTIVLDPGHGGPDTGAMVNGVLEKDVTLAFAKMLAGKLESSGHFNVIMTRATDVFIPLSERVHIARSSAAALMISIHADTLPESTDVSGATVYTVSDKASDAYAAKVAAKENEADAAVGLDGQADTAEVNGILFDLTRQETRAYSHVFARTLVNYWKVAGRLNKNPQRSAGFVVLKAPDVPSVLLELGYLSCPADAASLTSDEWREKATARMAEAVESYFADQHGPAKAAAGVSMPLVMPLVQASAGPASAK